jgi:hypothetical protein
MILYATLNFLLDIGGTQIYMTAQADALARREHEIAVCCDATNASAAHKVDQAHALPINRFGGLRPWLHGAKPTAEAARQFGNRHHSPGPHGASRLLVGFRLGCGDQVFRGGVFDKMRL